MADGGPRRPIPDYQDAPKDPENYVRLRLDIPGLKKKKFGSGPANAIINLDATELSLTVKVDLTDKTTPKNYEYHVKQLPDPILTGPGNTFWKVERGDEVVVMIRKASPRRWDLELEAKGLDVAQDS